MDIWSHVRALEGKTARTLDRGRPFAITKVLPTRVLITTSTGLPRTILRREIEEAWKHLKRQGTLTRAQVMASYSPFNPAYVVTILSRAPGVTHTLRPITLRVPGHRS